MVVAGVVVVVLVGKGDGALSLGALLGPAPAPPAGKVYYFPETRAMPGANAAGSWGMDGRRSAAISTCSLETDTSVCSLEQHTESDRRPSKYASPARQA